MTSYEIFLPEKIDLEQVKKLHEALIAATQSSTSVQVNASKLKYIDACGLQVLAAFTKLCSEKKMAMEWVDLSEEIKAQIALLGYSNIIMY